MSAKVTIKLIEDIRKARGEGYMPAEIADRYDVPVKTVRNLIRDIVPAKRTFLADRESEILMLVGLGHTQSDIARQLGVSPSSINKALARMEWRAAA